MRGRQKLAFHGHDLGLELVVALGELLDQAPGGAGFLGRERVQQRADEGVLDALVFSARHRARSQRVLDDSQVHTGLAGLLAHRGHLFDRDARVLGSDQGVRLGGDFCQLGDYFLLLGQVESHCTPPNELRARLLPLAVLGDAFRWRRGRSRVPVVACSETGNTRKLSRGGGTPSTQALALAGED
jgi:hypothetical protein